MLTVLVPLSDVRSFEGGGTAFWPTEDDAPAFSPAAHDASVHVVRDTSAAAHVMRPPRGTSLLFTGSVRAHPPSDPTRAPS
jgi:hypothetical protein